MLAVCLFLATAALLLVVRVWLPPTFEGVDPEAQVSARLRRESHGGLQSEISGLDAANLAAHHQ